MSASGMGGEQTSLKRALVQRVRNAPDRWRSRISSPKGDDNSEPEVAVAPEVASAAAAADPQSPSAPQQVPTVLAASPEVERAVSRAVDWVRARSASMSEDDLEAMFFSLDEDNSGFLSRSTVQYSLERIGQTMDESELGSALGRLGFTLSPSRFDELFNECDTNADGRLTLDEFKLLVATTGITPPSSNRFAMDLFQQYDEDNSGQIDKNEFRAVASAIQVDQRRRSLIACATAGVAALVVSRKSDEYQWGQRTFRNLYLEPRAEKAQQFAFPTALISSDLDEAVARTLSTRGYTAANTLFAHSTCSDEVNSVDEQLIDLMTSRWREGFALGGLGGLPFAGSSGFRAYLHHVPDKGRLLILFAPHVGIDADGRIGALQRDGQSSVSKACGAGIGAYKALLARGRGASPTPPSTVLDLADKDKDAPFDPELATIVKLLGSRMDGVESASDPIAFVTYQLYGIIKELVDSCITGTDDVWEYASEVAIVGGVMVNRRVGGDFFQPLSFEARRPGQLPTDLYAQTFGAKPNLLPVLGSNAAVKAVYAKGNAADKAAAEKVAAGR